MNFDLFRAVPGRLAATENSRVPCARPDCRGFRHDGEWSPLARWLAISLLPLAALALGTAAQANTLAVTATIDAACTTTGGSVPFGAYTPGTNKDVEGSFSVTCTSGANVNIHLDDGVRGDRTMANESGAHLLYELWQDPTRSTPWRGNGVGNHKVIQSFSQGTDGTQTVYARIPSQTVVPPGSYTDTVAINFTF